MKAQRRGARLAMSSQEIDFFLGDEWTCRVATVGADGAPHNTPLWFVWHGGALWLHSIVKSQRWVDIQRNPRVSVVVDAGRDFRELRGVELTGELQQVGEAPRTAALNAELQGPEVLYVSKYAGGEEFHPDGRHAWLRLVPEKIVSWDFRKMSKPFAVPPVESG